LDPDSAKSAKDVMVERAQKRKREEEADGANYEATGSELPRGGMKQIPKKVKKQKRERENQDERPKAQEGDDDRKPHESTSADIELKNRRKAEKLAAKKERQKVGKADARKERKQARKERKERLRQQKAVMPSTVGLNANINPESDEEANEGAMGDDDREEGISFKGNVGQDERFGKQREPASTATPSPAPESPQFDGPSLHSGTSSISSILPPGPKPHEPKEQQEVAPKLNISNLDKEEIQQRLKKKLEALRAARKADGPDGKPAKNRQELIEGRRRKEELRKAHKKEMRRKAKEEEQRKLDEELDRRSGSLLASPRSPIPESSNNFSFGRIAFADGQQTDPNLSSLVVQRKRKGPQDPLGALKAAQSKEARLSGYDEGKRTDIEEKDMWLNAKKRAHGERVRDDTSLLKKVLKRKESTKRQSEKEWNERVEGVQKARQVRQNKREENIRKRKEEKGGKGTKAKKNGRGKKVKSRPGFEGSFKARTSSKKR
jgi:hypothetical protein